MSSLSLRSLSRVASLLSTVGWQGRRDFFFQPFLLYPSYSFLGSFKLCRWLLSKQGALGEGSLLASGDHLLTPSSCLLFTINQLSARANYHTAATEAQKGAGEARHQRAKLTGRCSPSASLTRTEPGSSTSSGVASWSTATLWPVIPPLLHRGHRNRGVEVPYGPSVVIYQLD